MRTVLHALAVSSLVAFGACTEYSFRDDLACSETGECPTEFFCDSVSGNVCLRDLESCGNGDVDGEEVCDDGNRRSGDGCRADCLKLESCGDGTRDPAEICDDGNDISGDGCRADCLKLENCGDEVIDVGEDCDDGDQDDDDGCPSTCLAARCGDGVVRAGVEVCDDGNADETDGCHADCVPATCGDGVVRAGFEDCDDANSNNVDGCLDTCAAATCGDGFLRIGAELCDDGDLLDGNGCNSDCRTSRTVQIVAGDFHTCALRASGKVRCWGSGQGMGYPATSVRLAASAGDVEVGGVVVQLAAGEEHTCALLDTGAVRCWGIGSRGRLGYANTNRIGDDETPASAGDVNVGGVVKQIAAGLEHTCAVLTSGSVRCWGSSGQGRLGYGNTEDVGDDETPATVGDVDVGGPVEQISAGGEFTCALLTTGAVRCWGRGGIGGLGYGNTNNIGDDETPVTAGDVDIGGAVVQIDAGHFHTCALLDTGAVRCWGVGDFGELGYGNEDLIGDDETPASAGDVSVGGRVAQISAAGFHTCAVLETGAVRCWGIGGERLGLGSGESIGDDELPIVAPDVPVGGKVVQVYAARQHTCALLATGAVRCWGDGANFALGYGTQDDVGLLGTPAAAGDVDIGDTIKIAMGDQHTCALSIDGKVRCWGSGANGRLGYGNTSSVFSAASAAEVAVGSNVVQLVAGSAHTCALLGTGGVRCWGANASGQLGYGNTGDVGDNETPASAGDVSLGGTAVQLAAGGAHTCALMSFGAIKCWGLGAQGQLGYGNTQSIGDNETPQNIGAVVLNEQVVLIAAGASHTCARLLSGKLRCWGLNSSGQLGYGNTQTIGDNETPFGDVATGGVGSIAQLVAGADHTCVRLSGGSVRCWGANGAGELGYGNTQSIGDNESPLVAGNVLVNGAVSQLTAGGRHTCARLVSGAVRCWGAGIGGQLGYVGTSNVGDDEEVTADVFVGPGVEQVTAGGSHTCARIDASAIRCWGRGGEGQLGYGNSADVGDNETPLSAGNVPL